MFATGMCTQVATHHIARTGHECFSEGRHELRPQEVDSLLLRLQLQLPRRTPTPAARLMVVPPMWLPVTAGPGSIHQQQRHSQPASNRPRPPA